MKSRRPTEGELHPERFEDEDVRRYLSGEPHDWDMSRTPKTYAQHMRERCDLHHYGGRIVRRVVCPVLYQRDVEDL